MTGMHRRSPSTPRSDPSRDWISMISSGFSFRKPATSVTLAFFMNCFVISAASSLVLKAFKGALSEIAFWKSPLASGSPISTKTLSPPADSPMRVMFSGSPPNRAILFFSQRSAMT